MKPKSAIALNFEKAEWDVFLGKVPEEIKKNSNLVLFGDGQWIVRKNLVGVFQRRYKDLSLPGMGNGPEASFKFKLPKIPLEILKLQVSFYRQVMEKWNQAEAYSTVMYDLEEKKYFLSVPKQRVSKGQVDYDREDFRKQFPSNRYIEVISAHSHNNMPAFFSGVDDNDERGDMIYMVMGHLGKDVPMHIIRASVAGKECCKLKLTDIFDVTEDQWTLLSPGWKNLHPAKWMKRINVEAGYKSAHVSSASNRLNSGVWGTGRSNSRRTQPWPRRTGRVKTFESRQLPMDFAKGFAAEGAEEEERQLMFLGVQLAKSSKHFAMETCFEMFFESIIEMGYEIEIERAMKKSGLYDTMLDSNDIREQSDEEFLASFYDDFAEDWNDND